MRRMRKERKRARFMDQNDGRETQHHVVRESSTEWKEKTTKSEEKRHEMIWEEEGEDLQRVIEHITRGLKNIWNFWGQLWCSLSWCCQSEQVSRSPSSSSPIPMIAWGSSRKNRISVNKSWSKERKGAACDVREAWWWGDDLLEKKKSSSSISYKLQFMCRRECGMWNLSGFSPVDYWFSLSHSILSEGKQHLTF